MKAFISNQSLQFNRCLTRPLGTCVKADFSEKNESVFSIFTAGEKKYFPNFIFSNLLSRPFSSFKEFLIFIKNSAASRKKKFEP